MNIQDGRKLKRDALEAVRKRAVQAFSEGLTQGEAAKLLGVSRASVNSWVKIYRQWGEKALAPKRKGRPKGWTPVAPVSGSRFGCDMIATVTNRGLMRF